MKLPHKLFIVTSLIATSLNIYQAKAAGYSSDLYSASGIANAYAGSVTGIHDASDIFTTPLLVLIFRDLSWFYLRAI